MKNMRFLAIAASVICLLPNILFAQSDVPSPAAPAVAPAAPTPSAAALAPPTAADANAPVTRAEIPDLVKKALLDNPEVIMEAAQRLHDKKMAEAQKDAKDGIAKHQADLFDSTSPSIGDAKTADVTIVEFFDYHCGYCKHLLPTITQLVNEDKKVRVVFKEFPILSQDSADAARAALAVNRIAPDKYFAFHTALMNSNGKFDEKSLLDIAKKEGIDTKKLKTEMDKADIQAIIAKNHAMAEDLGIRGTPAIIIGDTLLPGALPYEELKKRVEEARAAKKPVSAESPKS